MSGQAAQLAAIVQRSDDLWCPPCTSHVRMDCRLVDATYLSQHGEECPFQVPDTSARSGNTSRETQP